MNSLKKKLCLHYLHMYRCEDFEDDIVDKIVNAVEGNDKIFKKMLSKNTFYAKNFETIQTANS